MVLVRHLKEITSVATKARAVGFVRVRVLCIFKSSDELEGVIPQYSILDWRCVGLGPFDVTRSDGSVAAF